MAKKGGKKKVSSSGKKTSSGKNLENAILNNLISLQKVNTALAEKFEKLSDQISDLLALFEMSARTLSKHPQIQITEKDKEFLEKIDRLLDQNKTIAKGLMLMESKMREKIYGHSPPGYNTPQRREFPPR